MTGNIAIFATFINMEENHGIGKRHYEGKGIATYHLHDGLCRKGSCWHVIRHYICARIGR